MAQATGDFAFRAARIDRRFSYGLHVPSSFRRERAESFRILVAVHGSERAPEAAREGFADLAEECGYLVLAPLFPMAVTDDEEAHNYIFLKYRDIRYDLVLLSMIDEVAAAWGVPSREVSLAGFSGGGQFAHRFMYLHGARLAAVSVGAPGIVNTLDDQVDWFVGVRDVKSRFGCDVDRAALRGLPVQVVVGAEDVGADVLMAPGSPLYMDGVNASGATRVERARTLHRVLLDAGADCRFDLVPGAGHQAQQVQLAVDAFFRRLRPPAR